VAHVQDVALHRVPRLHVRQAVSLDLVTAELKRALESLDSAGDPPSLTPKTTLGRSLALHPGA